MVFGRSNEQMHFGFCSASARRRRFLPPVRHGNVCICKRIECGPQAFRRKAHSVCGSTGRQSAARREEARPERETGKKHRGPRVISQAAAAHRTFECRRKRLRPRALFPRARDATPVPLRAILRRAQTQLTSSIRVSSRKRREKAAAFVHHEEWTRSQSAHKEAKPFGTQPLHATPRDEAASGRASE